MQAGIKKNPAPYNKATNKLSDLEGRDMRRGQQERNVGNLYKEVRTN